MNVQHTLNAVWAQFAEWVSTGEVGLYFALPTFVGMILIERIGYFFFSQKKWNIRDTWANILIFWLNVGYELLIGILIPISIFYLLYEHARLFTLPSDGWGWLLAFLIHDFIYYIDHWIAHRTGLFWAFHHVHHSSKEFNLTVASRGFFLDGTKLSQPLYFLMPILGMSVFQIIVVAVLKNLFGIFNHTRLVKNMGFLEYILATPSNHRVHHGSDLKYLDKNFGQVLIIWDILFGTFQREEEEPTYGLVKNIDTHHPVEIELAGVRWLWRQIQSADKWSDKLKYLYKPPGWRHDGPGETAKELRERATRSSKALASWKTDRQKIDVQPSAES